ncbi:MAG TPA: hypothetical protein VFJ68_01525 [Casimicrobiaceae bacterium]|nr:hypothetical protein [Casimicrobiaceae bacterium]
MTNWLLGHQAALQYGLLLSALGGLLAWETWRPRRDFAIPTGVRWFNQIALTALGSLAVRVRSYRFPPSQVRPSCRSPGSWR